MTGSVGPRGGNRWQIRASLGRDPATGRYEYVSREFQGTEAGARRAPARLAAEVDQGLHHHSERHTVAELLERWMEHIEGLGRAPTTLVRSRSAIRHHIGPRLGSIRIDRLQPSDIDRFYSGLAKAGLKPVSIRKAHAILSASFNQAVKWGWIERSPVPSGLSSVDRTAPYRAAHPERAGPHPG
jgi:integrase